MANYKVTSSVYKIGKFLGVNENPDGDTNNKVGEASTMRNFLITDDWNLQIRGGTRNIAGIMSAYSLAVASESTDLVTELNASTDTFTVKPNCSVTDTGLLSLSGTGNTMSYANHATYTDQYYEDTGTGLVWKFVDCEYTEATGDLKVTGGAVDIASETTDLLMQSSPTNNLFYTALEVENDVVDISGSSATGLTPAQTVGKYFKRAAYGIPLAVWKMVECEYIPEIDDYTWHAQKVTSAGDDSYVWQFKAVTASASTSDNEVRGLWSGYVNSLPMITAACNGKLWALTESGGVWSKEEIGSVTTTNRVCMFGYREKLYIMNGSQYLCFDGTEHNLHTYTADGAETAGDYYITVESVNYKFTLAEALELGDELVFDESDNTLTLNGDAVVTTTGAVTTETDLTADLVVTQAFDVAYAVTGYRPLTVIAAAPATGTGTLLEKINKLNGLQRIRYSPASSATDYQLPYTSLTSIDYVTYLPTSTTYTLVTSAPASASEVQINTSNGTLKFHTAPADGTDTLEVGFTISTNNSSEVKGMRFAELYNGSTDSRVFLYGDGTNKAIYSGIEYGTGRETAEYFPDLNECLIGDENTPITAMVRHYDRLLAFKADSAYSINYDVLTLEDSSVIAGFFLKNVNKVIGNTPIGMAQIVENSPFTLDGTSIYRWAATSTSGNVTGDQRNAQRISQRVETTLRDFVLSDTVTFYDKIAHEYYAVYDGTAVVQNTENDTWYVYEDFPATCMVVYDGYVYFGTPDGYVRKMSREYLNDNGDSIDAYWESGSMDFGADFRLKSSDCVYVGLKPETGAAVTVTAETDNDTTFTDTEITASGTVNAKMKRVRMRAKNFSHYKLIFKSNSNDSTATIVSADINVFYSGTVR